MRFTIRAKLGVGFGILIFVMVASSMVAYFKLSDMGRVLALGPPKPSQGTSDELRGPFTPHLGRSGFEE